MKTHISVFFFFSIILFSLNSFGQTSDPTYSAHNYKHPNKAQAAKKANKENLTVLQPAYAEVPATQNYKAQNRYSKRQIKKVNTVKTGRTEGRNYKQQFAPSIKRK